ncbi:MAG TPA: carboxypeptidase regulatory-like domain-containing protein [Xanthobacteraceae bacterium]|nr:carboxypeptidase regulatory-like domain-containing protein [Xanthobacteraceae bacterium]
MRNTGNFAIFGLAAVLAAAMAATALTPVTVQAADAVLNGTIRAAGGQALGGVTVSARADGSNVVTSVFTDESGNYYFPPMAGGKYQVWAQAITFATARGDVDLGAARRQDFTLAPIKDFVRQLPGDMLLAALPDATPEDAAMKQLVLNSCTGCHTPSYILQHRFDEAGWNAIINLMKHVNVSGIYQGPDHKAAPVLEHEQKRLAAYLARARGPGETSMRFDLRPRPSGEAARVVFTDYEAPADPDVGMPHKVLTNNGTDWSLGTPSYVYPGFGVHDAWIDADGKSVYFTCNVPNSVLTLGKFDLASGAFTPIKVTAANGLAAPAHGMTRDPDGTIWFNVNPSKGGLARIDTKTDKIEVFIPPEGMAPTGGATTVDYDGRGMIWVSSPTGALRFDPATEKFTEYKSPTAKSATGGVGLTYGVAADRDGNGYWAQMAIDTVGIADGKYGTAKELKLPPNAAARDRLPPEQIAFYDSVGAPDFSNPVPYAQGPRRMGTDKNDDVLYVGNSWAGTLSRINTRTQELTTIPLPAYRKPYQIAVDSRHNAWLNIWMTDQVLKYDPAANSFTAFDLPTRGSEVRYVSLYEKDGQMKVVLPSYRTRKVTVMSFRSDADIQAAKAEAAR